MQATQWTDSQFQFCGILLHMYEIYCIMVEIYVKVVADYKIYFVQRHQQPKIFLSKSSSQKRKPPRPQNVA